MSLALTTGLLLLVVFAVLLIVGVPIAVTIGISSVIGVLAALPWENAVFTASQRIFTGINSFSCNSFSCNSFFRSCREYNEFRRDSDTTCKCS